MSVGRTYRFCLSEFHEGPRWRHVVYFYPRTWGDEEKTWVSSYQSQCHACQKVSSRVRKGFKDKTGRTIGEWKKLPKTPQNVLTYIGIAERLVHPRVFLTPEQKKQRRKERYQTNRKNWSWIAKRRRDNRDNARMRNMELGLVKNPRGSYLHNRKAEGGPLGKRLPIGPFREWWCSIEGRNIAKERLPERLFDTADSAFREGKHISHAVMDEIAVAYGNPALVADLYPDE